jgi:hypothetical protein
LLVNEKKGEDKHAHANHIDKIKPSVYIFNIPSQKEIPKNKYKNPSLHAIFSLTHTLDMG